MASISKFPRSSTPQVRNEKRRKARNRAQARREREERSQAAVWHRMSRWFMFDFECDNDNKPGAKPAGWWMQ